MCERNIHRLPLTCPQPGTWIATQACALTGNQMGSPSVCRLVLNPLISIFLKKVTTKRIENTNLLQNVVLSLLVIKEAYIKATLRWAPFVYSNGQNVLTADASDSPAKLAWSLLVGGMGLRYANSVKRCYSSSRYREAAAALTSVTRLLGGFPQKVIQEKQRASHTKSFTASLSRTSQMGNSNARQLEDASEH